MKKIFFFILFILNTAYIFCQDTMRIRELQSKLHTTTEDSAKCTLLITLGWEFRNAKPDSGIYYTNEALQIAEKLDDIKKIAKAKGNIGRLYYNMSDDETALKYYNESMTLSETLKDTAALCTMHLNIGYSYNRMNRISNMLSEFITALDLAEKSKNKDKKSTSLYALSNYYIDLKDYATAESYLLKSLAIDKELNNESFLASDYQYLGLCYSRLNRYKESEAYLLTAIKMYDKLDDNFHKAASVSFLGDLYDNKKEYKKSADKYIEALQMMKDIGATIEVADVYDNIANEYFRMKDYQNALEYAKEGLAVAEKINAVQQSFYLNNTLSKIFAEMHDYENAFAYSSRVPVLMDTIYTREERGKLLEMQTKFETEQKEKENQILKAENDATSAKLQRNRVLLIAAGISLLLLSLLTFVIYRNRKAKIDNIKQLKLLNKQLEKQKTEISEINALLRLRALRTQMNPHFIFNCMNSIQECILLDHADDATKYLSKLSKLMRMVLEYSEQENISLDKELEMLDLYLQLETVRLKKNFQYMINMDENLPAEEIKVPTLILQPFAENAIWHGLLHKDENRNLTINIKAENGWLQCTVQDNGIGRAASAARQLNNRQYESRGIKIITERLDILNRHYHSAKAGFEMIDLFDEEKKPAGTKVIIMLPLNG